MILQRYRMTWVSPDPRVAALEKRVQALETALYMIRDREWMENALDPQWAAQVARDALKEDDA